MLDRTTINKIVPILRRDARRALRMRVRGFPRPYYVAFVLRDLHWFNTWASSGSTYRRRSDHTRNVYCDLRVNSYRNDQTSEGGLNDNDEERESSSHVQVPIDDKCCTGLRLSLWRLSESRFREALSDFSKKETARLSTIDPNQTSMSFHKLGRCSNIKYSRPEKLEEDKWVRFCKRASKWISDLPQVSVNWVEFDATQETKIFVNTENRIIVQHNKIFSLSAKMRNLTKEGLQIEQELVLNCASQRELPNMQKFKELLLHKHRQLLEMIKAKRIHAFSGPVLLAPTPAGLLFHEAIGHRLEGSRLLSTGEGQTFKGQIGKRILDVDLDISDNPRLKQLKGRRCIAAYEFDDEGTPAAEALLVKGGHLRGFLNTRAGIPVKNNKPNGHARNRKAERPVSRMAVTVIKGNESVSWDELKQLLVAEIRAQGKPFGMIVYETAGGETETSNYDFQVFSGEIAYATLVYPDGREEVVRGVDFVGTPLQALSNIIAVGNEQVLDNHYCGAESGMIPVSTICPAILLKTLELQAKQEERVTQYILPRPRF
ncbi:MAG: hypothetical protein GX589_09390 [Deltaproteobacteria bacterium]|nr:hypothetical protein [Deltaproteobacteria bacterium]